MISSNLRPRGRRPTASPGSPTRCGCATKRWPWRASRLGILAGVRLTEFNERVVLRFGAAYGTYKARVRRWL